MKSNCRLVMLGAGATGKSSLLSRFLDGIFETKYNPTVDDFDSRTIQLPNGDFHLVEFLDTAGFHQFPAMRRLSILTGRAFVVVYSVDNYASFRDALNLSDLINDIKGYSQIPIILVGNKKDLTNRKVATNEAQNEATSRDCIFIETSAKTNENVQELFMELMMKIFKAEPEITLKTNRKVKRRRRNRKWVVNVNNNSKSRTDKPDQSRCLIM